MVQRGAVRRAAAGPGDRLRWDRGAGGGTQAEDDHRRRRGGVRDLRSPRLGLSLGQRTADRDGRRVFNGLLDFRPQRVAAAQLARIDPHFLLQVGERPTEFADERMQKGKKSIGRTGFGHSCVYLNIIYFDKTAFPYFSNIIQ